MSDLLQHGWPGLLLILLVFGFLPGFTLRLLVLIYPKDDARRKELLAELYALPWHERPLFTAQQLETVVFEGIPLRWAARPKWSPSLYQLGVLIGVMTPIVIEEGLDALLAALLHQKRTAIGLVARAAFVIEIFSIAVAVHLVRRVHRQLRDRSALLGHGIKGPFRFVNPRLTGTRREG